ncbi:MAG: hypothetical protein PF574_08060 [Candidatus Delongbacteria bacterium]|jgi:hypothetical protein|nr:hypothetical protein [Candidatus Delongbacteria bacterium]
MSEDKKKSKNEYKDVLNNREGSEGPSIYGSFRKRILDDDEKQLYNKVQDGAKTSYEFEGESSLEGDYVRKVDKKIVILYVTISTILLTSLIIFLYSLIPGPEDKFKQYKSLRAEFEKLSVKMSKKRNEIENIVLELKSNEKYKDLELEDSEGNILSDQQLETLSMQAKTESDKGIKSKINTIMQTDKELKALQKDIQSKYKGLGSPEVMTDEIGHEEIALSYLITNKGLTQHEALSIVENVNIFSYAYEGLYVWNFYEDGFYGSFITKGEADKTPNDIKKLAKRAYRARISALLSEKQKLTEKIEMLEAEKRQGSADVNKVSDEQAQQVRIDRLNEENRKLQEKMDKKQQIADLKTINYKLLGFEDAQKNGIITESMWDGVKLSRSTGHDYSSKVDFSVTDNLVIKPKQFGLSTFTEVYVFPKSLVAAGDIKIVKSDRICRIEFLDQRNLLNKNILIIAK